MAHDELWKMEKSFWLDGPEFYGHAMAPDARMVFPDPVGILAGEEIVEGLKQAPRWAEVRFDEREATGMGDTVVLAYRATGKREGEAAYVALCMSTYVKGGEGWRLLAHQQSPVSV